MAVGAASAPLNVVGGVGGPPIGLYAASAGWEPATTRGNLHAFFILHNTATALVLGMVLPGAPELAALAAGTASGCTMNIVVFGAGGRAGRQIVAEAHRRGHRVTAVVRDPASHGDLTDVRVVAGDVTDETGVARGGAARRDRGPPSPPRRCQHPGGVMP
ncbi:NAD(P)H-binding protein [Nonomuraea sp. CA-218870]|uniref:NAD(P)H-binding protein n=1 Tax=Nonomuraea sp. CA-218870 TaxID=3239998 RepID=UPI003D93FEBA